MLSIKNIVLSQFLAKRFRIMSIPCVILFKDGQEMNRLVGARDKEEYADAIDEIMG